MVLESYSISNAELSRSFDTQLARKLELGYPNALGQSPEDYFYDYYQLLQRTLEKIGRPANSELVFVEPRIPLERQMAMNSVKLDPSAFSLPPDFQYNDPYAVWSQSRGNHENLTPNKFVKSLPKVVRLATPLEAINSSQCTNMNKFYYVSGGPRQEILRLDTFLGSRRIAGVESHEFDSLYDAMVTFVN